MNSMPVKMVEYTLWDLKGDIVSFFFFIPPKYSTLSIGILQIVSMWLFIILLNFITSIIIDLMIVTVGRVAGDIIRTFVKRLFGSAFLLLFSVIISFVYGFLIRDIFALSFVYIGLISSIHLPFTTAFLTLIRTNAFAHKINYPVMVLQGLLSQYLMSKSILYQKTDLRIRKLFAIILLCVIFGLFYAFEYKYLVEI